MAGIEGGVAAVPTATAAATTVIGKSGSAAIGGSKSSVLARSTVKASVVGTGPAPGTVVDLLAALELANTTRQGVTSVNGPQQMLAYYLQGNKHNILHTYSYI